RALPPGKAWVGYFHVWETAPDGSVCAAAKDSRIRYETEARGTQRPRRIYSRGHGQARKTRRIDFHVRRALESLLRCEGRSVVEEDQGEPEVPFRQATFY